MAINVALGVVGEATAAAAPPTAIRRDEDLGCTGQGVGDTVKHIASQLPRDAILPIVPRATLSCPIGRGPRRQASANRGE